MRNSSCVLAFFMTQAVFFSTSHFVQRVNFKNRIKIESICVKQGYAIIHNYVLEQFGNKDLTLCGACFQRYPCFYDGFMSVLTSEPRHSFDPQRGGVENRITLFLMAASRYSNAKQLGSNSTHRHI